MDASIVCLSCLLAVAPQASGAEASENPDAPLWVMPIQVAPIYRQGVLFPLSAAERPFDVTSLPRGVLVRAQSRESPFYQRDPASGGGTARAPSSPATPANVSSFPQFMTVQQRTYGQPAPTYGQPAPALRSPFQAPAAPTTPVTPNGPFGTLAPVTPQPAPFTRFGVNGPQPYDMGASMRLDTGYIGSAGASGNYGSVNVFELDFAMPYVTPTGDGNMFTFTPQYDMRLFNGPATPGGLPRFPNDLYRFGFDFQYDFLVSNSNWSGELAFNPSINTDFEKSLTNVAINWDGRAVAYLQATRRLKLALGVLYWDRVDDVILPYAGVIWLPNDRWELRLMFPDSRISYFAGHVWGKPTWIYVRGKYDVEAYQVETPPGNRTQLQMSDWRIMFGARKDQGWGGTYLEAGWVFGREVEYAEALPGFSIGDAFTVRGGVRY